MKTLKWHNPGGYTLILVIHPGRRATLTLFFDEQVQMRDTFEWFQIEQAQAKAETLARLGNMERQAVRLGA